MTSKKHPNGPAEDFFTRLPLSRQHLIALVFLFALPVILYNSVFLGSEKLMGHDVIQWRAGAESIVEHQQSNNGENPLWATNMFSGMPAYTISQPRPVPNIDSLFKAISGNAHPLTYYWILLPGAYLLFVLLGFRPLTSILGSVVIGFTTYIPVIIEAGHYNKFMAYAFIPWMFVGYLMITRTDKKIFAFFLFALATTLEFRANHPQVTYYFLYLLGAWWLFDLVRSYRENNISAWAKHTALLAGGGVLAIVCSLEAYWSLLEYSQFSTRGGSTLGVAQGTGGLTLQYAFSWSQGFAELLTLVIPGLFGGSSAEAYWGPKPSTGGPHYMGAIIFILFLVGLFRSEEKKKYLFLGVGILTLLFSLGRHFESFNALMFNLLPFFDKFRTPEMWLIVSIFCFTIIGLYGMEYLIDTVNKKASHLKSIALPVGIALGLGLVFAMGSNALLTFEKPGEFQQYATQVAQQNNISPGSPQIQQTVSNYINTRLKPERREMARDDSIRYFVIALLGGGLIFAFYSNKLSTGYFLVGLVLLSSYDLLTIANRYSNGAARVDDNYTTEQVIQQSQRPIDEFLQQNVDSGNGWPYRVFPLADSPFQNAIPSYFYPTIGGYSGAKLSHYQDLIDNLIFTEAGGLNMATLDLLNVKYFTYPQQISLENFTQVYAGDNGYVYENLNVLPKAFFVDSVAAVSSPREAVELMNRPDFNPAEFAVVESSSDLNSEQDSTATITIETYEANFIQLRSQRDVPGFLVLSEIYYPAGWDATLDGEPIDIHKTDFVLRGFQVPAGDHTLTLRFEPQSVYWGHRISWAGHIILLLIGLAGMAKNYTGFGKDREVSSEQE